MTRLLFILLLLLQFSCGRSDVDSFPAHRGGDVSLPVGFAGGERYKPRLQYVSAGDTIVELSFLYVKEHNGIVEWEEGTVKLPFSAIHCYAWPRVSYKDTERGGLP